MFTFSAARNNNEAAAAQHRRDRGGGAPPPVRFLLLARALPDQGNAALEVQLPAAERRELPRAVPVLHLRIVHHQPGGDYQPVALRADHRLEPKRPLRGRVPAHQRQHRQDRVQAAAAVPAVDPAAGEHLEPGEDSRRRQQVPAHHHSDSGLAHAGGDPFRVFGHAAAVGIQPNQFQAVRATWAGPGVFQQSRGMLHRAVSTIHLHLLTG